MKSSRFFFSCILSGVATLFFCSSSCSVEPVSTDIEKWLSVHNKYRELHGVPSVVWSEKVAASALRYAMTCPAGHSGSIYGENLAWASYDMTIEGTVEKWYNEEPLYDYGNPGYIAGVGHFTQIVWKKTIEIGCAYVTGCTPGHSLRANTWVCHYFPPGNYRRQFSENVFPPLSLE